MGWYMVSHARGNDVASNCQSGTSWQLDRSGLGVAQSKHLAAVERMRVAVAAETAQEPLAVESAGLGQFDQGGRGPTAATATAATHDAAVGQQTRQLRRQSTTCLYTKYTPQHRFLDLIPRLRSDFLCRQRCLHWYNRSLITRYQWSVTDATLPILPIQDILVQSWNKCVKQQSAAVKIRKLILNHCSQLFSICIYCFHYSDHAEHTTSNSAIVVERRDVFTQFATSRCLFTAQRYA